MGYSGAAATNAGLAPLGGGSIASGGLGVVGGTALLVTALEFTTAVAIDTTVSMVFDRDEFVARSHEGFAGISTLPSRSRVWCLWLDQESSTCSGFRGLRHDSPCLP